MTLRLEEEGTELLTFMWRDLAKKVIEASLDFAEVPYETDVGVLFTTNDEIRLLNKEFRRNESPTDVLSFPMVDYTIPGKFDFLEDMPQYFHPESGELLLGDIVISKDKVFSQAQEYGHSLEREFAFLIAHSMLHLFGYDHLEDEERLVMEKMQHEILENLKILR